MNRAENRGNVKPPKYVPKTISAPRMMTIRETAKTGILPEHAIRVGVKQGRVPHIMVGHKTLINYDKLLKLLEEC